MSSPTQATTAMLNTQGFGSAPSSILNNAVNSTRSPTSSDIKSNNGYFQIGQRWINTVLNASFTLTSISPSNGVITATWTQEGGSGSGTVTSVTGTTNQIGVTPTTGAPVVSLPSAITAPGSLTTTTSLTATLGNITATNGNLVLGTAGNKLSITTGSNASTGVSGAMTGTPGVIAVATTACTASSVIVFSRATTGGTPGQVSITAQSTSGFTLTSTANETSTFNYLIIN